ncbi:hypothetical protein KO481_36450 [Nocardia sp. NEAU-G5]|uniref:Uncharacterized protein n=1 Tax=Nocardia albiluteola TaxID=2842303 RepID=A0ABS6B9P3_9NOCA|nr:hypothetical protein [Nocardia albiluteola]MBU3066999.1 hypothetical protein [Nocardia albiluteola]
MSNQPKLDIEFHDHLLPRVTAGRYQVDIRQVLKDDAGEIDREDKLPTLAHEFEIRAVQFVLDPGSVQAVYPARGAADDFSSALPHITLDRAILPWEREPKFSRVEARPPWLALLVFAEGELPDDPSALGETVPRKVKDIVGNLETGMIGSSAPGVAGPRIALAQLPPETPDSNCQTIDVPVETLRGVLPREAELYYLAHARYVSAAAQRANGEILTEGEFGVLTANRFPHDTGSYAVHLVSLEGHDRWLKDTVDSPATAVRLAVLHSWSFVHDPALSLDAANLLRNLIEPGNRDSENLALRLFPRNGSGGTRSQDAYVAERLRLGYVPVPQRAMSGDFGFAWYRGPATPVTAPEVPYSPNHHTTADHALIYEPDHGLFDVSYASAWTLGRTIALADPTYTAEITRARRELSSRAVALMAMATDQGRTLDTADGPGMGWLRTLADSSRLVTDALAAPRAELTAEDEAALLTELSRPAPDGRMGRALARGLLTQAAPQAALRAVADTRTGGMPQWLELLGLLRGIPFSYLVPDPRILPPESLRLFRIDAAWIDALVDGAASVGLHTSLDLRLDDTLRAATTARRSGSTPQAGLLIRSALVPAWPDIRITATSPKGPVSELRRDQPAPDTLLVLFDDVPDTVVLREPAEGIHFGVDGDRINLRELRHDQETLLGESLKNRWFPRTGSVRDHLRTNGTPGVLDLLGARGLIPALTTELNDMIGSNPLRTAQFALQMVNAPIEQQLLPSRTRGEQP